MGEGLAGAAGREEVVAGDVACSAIHVLVWATLSCVATGCLLRHATTSTCPCRHIAVHPTLPYVLTCSDDMLIKLWDWDKGWQCTQVCGAAACRACRGTCPQQWVQAATANACCRMLLRWQELASICTIRGLPTLPASRPASMPPLSTSPCLTAPACCPVCCADL